MQRTLNTAGLIHIRDRRLLLCFSNNKQAFYLPGGKLDPHESPEQGLCREIAEELGVQLPEQALRFFMHVSAPAYGEEAGVMMEQDCFITDELPTPVPAAEIGAVEYFSSPEYHQLPVQVPGVILVLEALKAKNLVD